MARVLFGVTGGIAAYKACEALRLLVRAGHYVLPLPTPGAERFVTGETFFALARKAKTEDPYPHLARADVLVVAPLSANTLAKLAHGLADNVLTEAALAHAGPLVLAPAMNTRMWEHPATQANLALVRERGAVVVGPGVGELAEGEVGAGRMAEPQEIAAAVEAALGARVTSALAGKHLLVTAGGTREPVDAVRFLGNRSSGRMGLALAAEANRRGAEVGAPGLERKRAMLHDKKVDLVVYNDIGRDGIGFDSPANEVVLLTERGEREVPKAPKETIAAAVLDEVERLLAEREVEPEGGERHGSA